ncbi:MAG: 4-amino-4-deoxy-L-arabinose transferase-like glycosyltransferase [Candidatus Omnitrophota bacterium]|jgi:4-amino-4-deoxy-L-arabinose transferase-like glycosyltransferase
MMSSEKAQNSTILLLLVVMVFAFALRVGMNITFQKLHYPPDPEMGSDHVEYNLIAKNLVRGEGYTLYVPEGPTAFRPPGTPYIIAGFYALFGIHHEAVRIGFSLLSALTCVPLFLIVRRFTNARWGLLAAFMLAIFPEHFYYSMHMFSEAPWTLLITMAAWLGIKMIDSGQMRWAILQGVLLGIAALTRPIGLLYPVLQGGLIAFWILGKEKRLGPVFKSWPRIFVPFLITLLTIAPWPIRNYLVLGQAVIFSTHGGVTLYGSYNETVLHDPKYKGRWVPPLLTPGNAAIKAEPDELSADKKASELARTFVAQHRRDLPKLVGWRLIRLIQPNPETPNHAFNLALLFSYGPLIPLILFGLITARRGPASIVLYAAVAMIILNAVLLYGDHRFRASIAPILISFAVIGLQVAAQWLRQRLATDA